MNKIFSYIHIPFCELKCKYCRFASIWVSAKLKIDFYVKNLISEIKKSPFKKEILSSIYFWGGTPSILSKGHLKNIILELKNKFGLFEDTEITIESTPNNITEDNLIIWKQLWINRLSIWIQTLNWDSLSEINRGNKWDIELCLNNIKNIWFDNVSLDFIIWLPHVKLGEILENIKSILDNYNFVKHISVYMLEEYYSPDKIIETKYDNITYPDDWSKMWIEDIEYLEEYSNIKKYLVNKWFHNYEISNFWKSWFECNHNKWYWNHNEIYAFWLWSWGLIEKDWKKYRYLNSDNFKEYYTWKKIFENKLTDNDIFLEELMFWLRTIWLKKEIYEKLDQERLNYFLENKYLIKKSDKITLSDKGVLVMDYILGEIIE